MQKHETNNFSTIFSSEQEEWMNHPVLLILLMLSCVFGLFIFNYKKTSTRKQQIPIETLDYSSFEEQVDEEEEELEEEEGEEQLEEEVDLVEKVSSTQFAKEETLSFSESSSDEEVQTIKQEETTKFEKNEEEPTPSSSTTTVKSAIDHNRLLLQQLNSLSNSQFNAPQKPPQQQGHLLSTHSFLMVCSKCNNLFATFIPPKQDSTLKDPVFPERFKTHPFTFGVLLGENKRRNVAFTPRFAEEDAEEAMFIPTLCQSEKHLEEEFDCRKILESDLAEMKDKSKMARDMGKLLRLFCKKCGTKVGSILKEPLELSVSEDLKLPFNTFMDQEDCSIVEKCHCGHSDSVDMSAYINSENIVNVSDSSTFRKVSLGEWKYSSLASMLFDMPEVPPKNLPHQHNRNRNFQNNSGRGRYPPRKYNQSSHNNNNRRNNQKPKPAPQAPQQKPPRQDPEGGKPKKKKSQKRKKKNNNNQPENKKVKVDASSTQN